MNQEKRAISILLPLQCSLVSLSQPPHTHTQSAESREVAERQNIDLGRHCPHHPSFKTPSNKERSLYTVIKQT